MDEPATYFDFDRGKAIEAILYVANRIPDPSFHSISKLLYFADKTSLERYGRLISGDAYYAMKFGPVPSNSYELMKAAPDDGNWGFRIQGTKEIAPLRDANVDELSQSDIECLDLVIDVYGRMPFWQKTENSHDNAWEEAWENRGDSKSVPMSIDSIIKLLKDGDKLIEHLRSQHD